MSVRIPWPLSAKGAAVADMVWCLLLTQSGRGAKKYGAAHQSVIGSRNGTYGTLPSSGSTSLRLDVGRSDHLGPCLEIVLDYVGELLRRVYDRLKA
jgi:hypothetical protein